MRFRLNPISPNGLEVIGDTVVYSQTSSTSSGISGVPDISYGTATPTDGVDTDSHFYYDTDDSTLYVYVNGVWYPLSGGTPPANSLLLMETGDFLLLETGDKIILG